MLSPRNTALLSSLTLAAACLPLGALAQSARPNAVLVELFTSEGCSSCPPADELLHQLSGTSTAQGQLIVGLSEHVSYWNGLGWKDPFLSEQYTNRQNDYGAHFGLDSVYTPQIVVNGRGQLVGNDRRSLEAAFATEASRKQIALHITSAQVTGNDVTFSYSAANLPANSSLQLVAVLVDDIDHSKVLRGENSGRQLTHASVARAFAPLGALHATEQGQMSLPLPPSFTSNTGTGHHLVLFAQQEGQGPVVGIDSKGL